MAERILFIYDYSLQLTGNEGRFIRHPYGTAHQGAECGHIGGRAYGRAMWTHKWQSVSYYLRQLSTTYWEWGRFIRHPYDTAHQGAECGHIGGRAYERAMWKHRWQSVPLLSTVMVFNLLGTGDDSSDALTTRHTRAPHVHT